MRRAPPVDLARSEKRRLVLLAENPTTPPRVARRARIVLQAALGTENREIARALRTSPRTVGLWRRRFLADRVPGVEIDAPRPGRPPTVPTTTIELILRAGRGAPQPGARSWSSRRLAERFGVSKTTVQRIRAAPGRPPGPAVGAPPPDSDREFLGRVTELVGLFFDLPERAMAFSVDPRGGHPSAPVIGARRPPSPPRRTRPAEFRAFLQRIDRQTPAPLEVHLLVDQGPGPPPPIVRRWLVRHPRFHLHSLPSGTAAAALFDRMILDLRRKRVRAGTPASAARLHAAVERYFGPLSARREPLVWTATAEEIGARNGARWASATPGKSGRR